MHRVLVVHGPNLNAQGSREPEIYGRVTLDEIQRRLEVLGREIGCEVESVQSNHEGVLVDTLFDARGRADGVLLNAAALTHTSVALHDAVAAAGIPVIEVHLSNPHARESFRHHSMLSRAVVGVIQGFGPDSYLLALRAMSGILDHGREA
jgi:3-dehydroquinate dehydratase-2